jgi:hypothetical protein
LNVLVVLIFSIDFLISHQQLLSRSNSSGQQKKQAQTMRRTREPGARLKPLMTDKHFRGLRANENLARANYLLGSLGKGS